MICSSYHPRTYTYLPYLSPYELAKQTPALLTNAFNVSTVMDCILKLGLTAMQLCSKVHNKSGSLSLAYL